MSYFEKAGREDTQKMKALCDSIEHIIKAIGRRLRKAKRAGQTKIRLSHKRKR